MLPIWCFDYVKLLYLLMLLNNLTKNVIFSHYNLLEPGCVHSVIHVVYLSEIIVTSIDSYYSARQCRGFSDIDSGASELRHTAAR